VDQQVGDFVGLARSLAHLSKTAPVPGTISGTFSSKDTNHTVKLNGRNLSVNGRYIAKPVFSKSGVSWSEQTNLGYSTGSLQFAAHGAMLLGFVASGSSPDKADGEPVTLVADQTDFITQICRNPAASPQVWEPGPPLGIGIDSSEAVVAPMAVLTDRPTLPVQIAVLPETPPANPKAGGNDAPPPSDDGDSVALEIFIAETDLDNDFHPTYPLPQDSRIELAFDGASFKGTMKPFDAPDKTYLWRGTSPESTMRRAAAQAAAMVVHDTDLPLGIMDLLSQDTANAASIAENKFNKFVIYGMDDDWREKLLGVNKPVLNDAEAAAFKDHASYFTNPKLWDAFLLRQLKGLPKEQGGPSTPISVDDGKKIDEFWTNGLLKLPEYGDASNRLTQLSYWEARPRIKEYTAVPDAFWARKLYDALTTEKALRQAVLAFLASTGDPVQIYRHTELLDALSPTRTETVGKETWTLATKYHSTVMERYTQQAGANVTLDHPSTVAAFEEWLPRWIEDYRQAATNLLKDPNSTAADRLQAQDVLNDLQKAEQAFGNTANMAHEVVADISAASGKTLYGKLQSYFKSDKASKIASGAGRLFSVGGFIFGLMTVIKLFKNWDNLSDEQKAEVVITTSELGVKLMGLVADFKAWEIIGKLADAPDSIRTYFSSDIGKVMFKEGDILYSEPFEAMADDEAGWQARFERVFNEDSRFMKAFGVLAALAAVGFSSYKIYEDRNAKVQTILNSLQLAADVCVLIGAAVATDCALSVLGPFGALAGVILMIVGMFESQPEPDRPADDYMNDRGNKALEELPAPSA
jgi:hypothetical protein